MSVARLLFCTDHDPVSWAIREDTWSPWSHVALIGAGDLVIEAVSIHGVRQIALADRLKDCARWVESRLPCSDPAAVTAAAASQLGKPYDYAGVVGLGLHRNWQCTDHWFCSELVAWAMQEGGSPLFRADAMRRITPADLWMLAPLADSSCRPAPTDAGALAAAH